VRDLQNTLGTTVNGVPIGWHFGADEAPPHQSTRNIVVSKFDDHLPLYRQAEIYAREGVELETSTLSGWVGATAAALAPLVEELRRDVMASDVLHGDNTPVPVLASGAGKTKTGRLWTYVRDERSCDGNRPPAAIFFYSPDRKGEWPLAHLKAFTGALHADGYAGFKVFTRATASSTPPAGPTFAASSLMCMPPTVLRSPGKRSTGSAPSME
jgi:hypothetical protein